MCNQHVMDVVKDRLASGRVNHGRRNFLKGGLAATAALASGGLLRPRMARADSHAMGEVMELSHVLGPGIPMYGASDPTPTPETLVTVEANGFYAQAWTFGEHSGTHMDAPAHFIAGAETVDVYAPANLVAPLVVIDISARAAEDPDAAVTPEDLMAWESANGEIPAGAFVAMYSGWESRWADVAAYRNPDDGGVMHFPAFGIDAVTMLLEERNIVGIGVDTLSQDIGMSTTFDVHVAILGAGKYGLENLAGLGALIGKPATVVVGVPRYANGSGGPCRVLAMA